MTDTLNTFLLYADSAVPTDDVSTGLLIKSAVAGVIGAVICFFLAKKFAHADNLWSGIMALCAFFAVPLGLVLTGALIVKRRGDAKDVLRSYYGDNYDKKKPLDWELVDRIRNNETT